VDSVLRQPSLVAYQTTPMNLGSLFHLELCFGMGLNVFLVFWLYKM
jgi:hypothetical protein